MSKKKKYMRPPSVVLSNGRIRIVYRQVSYQNRYFYINCRIDTFTKWATDVKKNAIMIISISDTEFLQYDFLTYNLGNCNLFAGFVTNSDELNKLSIFNRKVNKYNKYLDKI